MTVPIQISMNVSQSPAIYVMSMQTVMILMVATGVSAGQDSCKMDTVVKVMYNMDVCMHIIWMLASSYRYYCTSHEIVVVCTYTKFIPLPPSLTLLHADINECETSNTCDEHADCRNTVGNYWCECRAGFLGDGYNCTGQSCTAYHLDSKHEFTCILQILMSVYHWMRHVLMRIHIVSTLWVTSAVGVIQDSLEMDTTAQVSLAFNSWTVILYYWNCMI